MALNFRLETALLQDFPDLLVGALRVRGLAAAAGKVGAAELVTQAAQHVA
ncbi:MAG: hypothetical protein HGA90_04230, partial [Alphaproteobacteria bacterium]|nr:hypothetical protein [Alphaproteobacteria bacterium]